jgi:hypothetical protein
MSNTAVDGLLPVLGERHETLALYILVDTIGVATFVLAAAWELRGIDLGGVRCRSGIVITAYHYRLFLCTKYCPDK